MQGYHWEDELESSRDMAKAPRRLVTPPPPPAATMAQRSEPSERDKTLSPLAQGFVASLPDEAKPHYTCERYARIVNRIAMCWPDSTLTMTLFEDYFNDRRGTRQGFPPPALVELKRLHAIAQRRMSDERGRVVARH